MDAQPAVKNYFFGKCYKDIFHTMVQIWYKTTRPVVNEFHRIQSLFRTNIVQAIFSVICDILVFSVITASIILIDTLVSVALLVASCIIAVFVFAGYVINLCADQIFCIFKGIINHCPNCQKKFLLPTYLCPKCGAKHTSLRPSKYGIFKRKCNCGTKLPTTFFNGRQKLTAICPSCNTKLKDGGEHVEVVIPVVGGPSAGKTCYISMAIAELEKNAGKNGLVFAYSPTDDDDYEVNMQWIQRGQPPIKSADMRLKYYQFYLTPKGKKIKNLISLCDVAGEVYGNSAVIGEQVGYKNADALLMLFDPLSIVKYRKESSLFVDLSKYGVSDKPLDEILSTLILTLENMKCISSKSEIKMSVAVVFSKCDIPGLEDKIGESAVTEYMRRNSNVKSRDEAKNNVCEKFLRDYDEINFLNILKSKFKNVQFFTCSALGHIADGTHFAPNGVEEPVLWLVNNIQNIKVKNV